MGGTLTGTMRPFIPSVSATTPAWSRTSGNIFRVGIFLDFVWLTTRTEGPHGAYVRRARRNRIDPHGGEIERLATRTVAAPDVDVAEDDVAGGAAVEPAGEPDAALDSDGVLAGGECAPLDQRVVDTPNTERAR